MAADLLDSVGSPQVKPLRRRLVQLAPDSVADRAALVRSALRFRDLNAARDALREMMSSLGPARVLPVTALLHPLATLVLWTMSRKE